MIIGEKEISHLDINTVGAKLFLYITSEWGLTTDTAKPLLSVFSDDEYNHWISGTVSAETSQALELVSHLIAIYKLLHTIFQNSEQANAWVSKPSAFFDNISALDVIRADNFAGVISVRTLLESHA